MGGSYRTAAHTPSVPNAPAKLHHVPCTKTRQSMASHPPLADIIERVLRCECEEAVRTKYCCKSSPTQHCATAFTTVTAAYSRRSLSSLLHLLYLQTLPLYILCPYIAHSPEYIQITSSQTRRHASLARVPTLVLCAIPEVHLSPGNSWGSSGCLPH